MLASTMQHSTNNHTPHHPEETSRQRKEVGHPKKKHPPGVSSGPNSMPSTHKHVFHKN